MLYQWGKLSSVLDLSMLYILEGQTQVSPEPTVSRDALLMLVLNPSMLYQRGKLRSVLDPSTFYQRGKLRFSPGPVHDL